MMRARAAWLVGQYLVLVVKGINVMFNFTDPLFKFVLLAIVDCQATDPCP